MQAARFLIVSRFVGSAVLCVLCASFASAQENAPTTEDVLQTVLKRLDKVETELKRLKGKNGIKIDPADVRVVVGLSEPFLGSQYPGSTNEIRFFAVRATIINLTNDTIKVKPDQWTLTTNSLVRKIGEMPTQLSSMSFQYSNTSYRLSSLTTQSLEVTPGRNAVTWLVFSNLPKGTNTPDIELKLDYAEKKSKTIDVVDYFAKQLDLDIERMGPRKALGLVTIGGELNTVSLGYLVSQMDELVDQKVARVVLRWKQGATKLDNNLLSWFRQVAAASGVNQVTNNMYPQIPSAISDFHLVDPTIKGVSSKRTSTSIRNGISYTTTTNGYRNVHVDVYSAIQASLKTAYELVPRDELVVEIKSGHPLTRPAAIANGGGRLAAKDLHVLLELVADKDVQLQKAAIKALRHFGEPEAISTLMAHVRKNQEPLSSAAIESLAGSRYAAAHEALLGLLKQEEPTSRKTIVSVLGQYARPIWGDTLYGFVDDKDSGVRAEALEALVRVGHQNLFKLLKDALEGDDKALSTKALQHLVAREDSESESLALVWTLKYIEKSVPTSPMHQLLVRTKDQRAIDPLLKFLEKPGSHRSAVLNTLSQIGDQRVGKKMAELFTKLRNTEKRTVLSALHQQRSPAFYKIAPSALSSSDYGLVSTTCSLLQGEATPQAVELLKNALAKQTNTSRYSYICNALGTIGSMEARTVLQDAIKKESDTNRLNMLKSSLRNLFMRSPGMNYVRNGENYVKQNDLKKALMYLNIAVEVDPELPAARRARGNALLRLEKPTAEQLKMALEDYTKYVDYEKERSEGHTGLGLAQIRTGKLKAGIKTAEDQRKKFKTHNIYLYNMACIYSRAMESAKVDDKLENRDELVKTYTEYALRDLKASAEAGFTDYKWMKDDPDLKPLHGEAGFKAIIKKAPEEAPEGAKPGQAAPQKVKLPAIPQAIK
jgi:HEAT repeat protein